MTPDDDANAPPTEANSPPAPRHAPLSNIRIPSDWLAWRFLGLAHMAGLVLFIVMMAGFLWYVGHIERQERQTSLLRDTDWAQQSLKLSLRELQAHLVRLAPLWLADLRQGSGTRTTPPAGEDEGAGAARNPADFLASYPQVRYVALVTPEGHVLQATVAQGAMIGNGLEAGEPTQDGDTLLLPAFQDTPGTSPRRGAWLASMQSWQPRYSAPLMIPGARW